MSFHVADQRSVTERSHRAPASMAIRLLRATSLVVFLAFLFGLASAHWWIADLFANFRLHYAFALIVSGLMLLLWRDRRIGGLVLLAALWAGWPAAAHWGAPATANATTSTLRVISFNIWMRNPELQAIAAYLERSDAHVAILQEVSPTAAAALARHLPSFPHRWTGAIRAADVTLFSRLPLETTQLQPLAPAGVAAAHATLTLREQRIAIVGVHLHWPLGAAYSRLRNDELVGLSQFVRSVDEPVVVLGDFNLTRWSSHYKSLLAQSGLNDCGRGHGLDPTWPSRLGWFGIRIDHCFVSPQWRVIDARVGPHLNSDHRPIEVELELIRSGGA